MGVQEQGGGRIVGTIPDRVDGGAGDLFRRSWWAIALRGLLAIVLGILILTRPGMTLALLIMMLGTYLFFDGIFTLVAAFNAGQRGQSWWPYLLEGLLSVAIGLLAFARPTSTALLLVILIAARAIVVGMVEIGTGISVRRTTGASAWLLWLSGIVSLAFGILLLRSPTFGLVMVWMVGMYTIIFGILLDVEAFRLKDTQPRQLSRAA